MDPLKNCNAKKKKGSLEYPHETSSLSSSKVALDNCHIITSLSGTEPKISQASGKQIRPISSSTLSPLPFSPSSNSKRSMSEIDTIQQCKKLSKKSSDDSMPYSKNIDLNESVERLWRKHDEGQRLVKEKMFLLAHQNSEIRKLKQDELLTMRRNKEIKEDHSRFLRLRSRLSEGKEKVCQRVKNFHCSILREEEETVGRLFQDTGTIVKQLKEAKRVMKDVEEYASAWGAKNGDGFGVLLEDKVVAKFETIKMIKEEVISYKREVNDVQQNVLDSESELAACDETKMELKESLMMESEDYRSCLAYNLSNELQKNLDLKNNYPIQNFSAYESLSMFEGVSDNMLEDEDMPKNVIDVTSGQISDNLYGENLGYLNDPIATLEWKWEYILCNGLHMYAKQKQNLLHLTNRMSTVQNEINDQQLLIEQCNDEVRKNEEEENAFLNRNSYMKQQIEIVVQANERFNCLINEYEVDQKKKVEDIVAMENEIQDVEANLKASDETINDYHSELVANHGKIQKFQKDSENIKILMKDIESKKMASDLEHRKMLHELDNTISELKKQFSIEKHEHDDIESNLSELNLKNRKIESNLKKLQKENEVCLELYNSKANLKRLCICSDSLEKLQEKELLMQKKLLNLRKETSITSEDPPHLDIIVDFNTVGSTIDKENRNLKYTFMEECQLMAREDCNVYQHMNELISSMFHRNSKLSSYDRSSIRSGNDNCQIDIYNRICLTGKISQCFVEGFLEEHKRYTDLCKLEDLKVKEFRAQAAQESVDRTICVYKETVRKGQIEQREYLDMLQNDVESEIFNKVVKEVKSTVQEMKSAGKEAEKRSQIDNNETVTGATTLKSTLPIEHLSESDRYASEGEHKALLNENMHCEFIEYLASKDEKEDTISNSPKTSGSSLDQMKKKSENLDDCNINYNSDNNKNGSDSSVSLISDSFAIGADQKHAFDIISMTKEETDACPDVLNAAKSFVPGNEFPMHDTKQVSKEDDKNHKSKSVHWSPDIIEYIQSIKSSEESSSKDNYFPAVTFVETFEKSHEIKNTGETTKDQKTIGIQSSLKKEESKRVLGEKRASKRLGAKSKCHAIQNPIRDGTETERTTIEDPKGGDRQAGDLEFDSAKGTKVPEDIMKASSTSIPMNNISNRPKSNSNANSSASITNTKIIPSKPLKNLLPNISKLKDSNGLVNLGRRSSGLVRQSNESTRKFGKKNAGGVGRRKKSWSYDSDSDLFSM